ncbi:hypothetical protein [Actinoplanes sp. NPDC051851]|uniref:hypothetical protein n=1 Tax=Actinoplanes sp. NPDC051851 TaxID=3154753 RepID=UPI00342D01A6
MTDDDLRTRLRAADPAASLPPMAPQQLDRLLEETMSTTSFPWRRVALIAAAFVLLAGAGLLFLRPATPTTEVLPVPSAVTVDLTATGARAKCVEPTAEVLRDSADFAFAGTVTGIDGTVVTLQVSKVYLGATAAQVRVTQEDGGASDTMLGSGTFETGKEYLVAAAQGSILICGYSGEADAVGLRALYEAAF